GPGCAHAPCQPCHGRRRGRQRPLHRRPPADGLRSMPMTDKQETVPPREPYSAVTGVAVPISQANVDTDQIIPARYLSLPREEMKPSAFRAQRYNENGTPKPEFVMNRPEYADAAIIVAGRNFACGSSREMAVTVLVDNGYKAFIAPSFGDIFFNNCFQNGVL